MSRRRTYDAGIDLGTTNTVCAVWEEGSDHPEVIEITQAVHELSEAGLDVDPLLPSSVCVLRDSIWVGAAAQAARVLHRGTTFTSTKRLMGRRWSHCAAGQQWTPERVAASVLATVRQELHLRYRSDPRRLVVTVPSSFDTAARRATLHAVEMAGFSSDTVRLFDEPTAALLAESMRQRGVLGRDGPSYVMVVDVGGGTLDVSTVALSTTDRTTRIDVVGLSRFTELAGDDFDLSIAGLLLHRYQQERGPIPDDGRTAAVRLLCQDLMTRAKEHKCTLSALMLNRKQESWPELRQRVHITHTLDGTPWSTQLTAIDLGTALRQYFHFERDPSRRRSEPTFFRPLQESLDSASSVLGHEITMDAIEHVWLAGGSASLPLIPEAVRLWTKRSPRMVARPLECVAMGAAWYAGIEAGRRDDPIEFVDRMLDGLYLELADGTFETIVAPRQPAVPFRRTYPNLLTLSKADKGMEVNVFIGSDGHDHHHSPGRMPAATWQPALVGRVEFDEVLPPGQPIVLDVELTENRVLDLGFSAYYRGKRHDGVTHVTHDQGGNERAATTPLLLPINGFAPGGRA